MTVDNTLLQTIATFKLHALSTPKLDAEVLLSYVIKHDRAWLLAHPEYVLSAKQLQKYQSYIARRIANQPIAYITGKKDFYGREFSVNKHVLVPRPESESFITLLKYLKNELDLHVKKRIVSPLPEHAHLSGFLHNILDMGTGSGCLAITVKLEFGDTFVTATDTSTAALKIAIKNALTYEVPVVFKKQNLLNGDKNGYDVVLANLPYVPIDMQDKSILHEPPKALYSGSDGLSHYRKLFKQLAHKHIRFVMTESLLDQHKKVEELANKANYQHTKTDNLVQLFTKISG